MRAFYSHTKFVFIQFKEYDEAAKVYFDILKADQNRYGDNDLVCAIDYHNLGVTNLLAGDLNASLHYFQESVFLKRECLGENDINVAVSIYDSCFYFIIWVTHRKLLLIMTGLFS